MIRKRNGKWIARKSGNRDMEPKCGYKCLECGQASTNVEGLENCPDCGSHRFERTTPPEWRTIKGRNGYPEVGTVCLTWFYFYGGKPEVMVYKGEGLFVNCSGFLTEDITHWMSISSSQAKRLAEYGEFGIDVPKMADDVRKMLSGEEEPKTENGK